MFYLCLVAASCVAYLIGGAHGWWFRSQYQNMQLFTDSPTARTVDRFLANRERPPRRERVSGREPDATPSTPLDAIGRNF